MNQPTDKFSSLMSDIEYMICIIDDVKSVHLQKMITDLDSLYGKIEMVKKTIHSYSNAIIRQAALVDCEKEEQSDDSLNGNGNTKPKTGDNVMDLLNRTNTTKAELAAYIGVTTNAIRHLVLRPYVSAAYSRLLEMFDKCPVDVQRMIIVENKLQPNNKTNP